MVLVDTSVWIEVFRRVRPLDIASLVDMDDIVTCWPVIQEVLQGFRDERAFRIARSAMLNLPILDDPLNAEVFESAVNLYRSCRRAGVTVRSSVDCLVAASALRHDVEVFHRDRDYARLAKFWPLKQRAL